ncbi:phenylalanine--tRNA ligase subunit beta [Campylobacter mucosalis]|uniref:Phenylalanine--tRNA ligase beta subunit n=1 Tax=Campylobacter mucosalis CCUG 21559 TaxID=1032067 RepID=A0A6G5QIC0_9BACT|nr:phenylalanine--tRNA ligase subunit beta [Campylobacter mucosalis]QCD45372.1 phenylalanyl-tRNA synthetase, beta subunit [Campylobacter mucosalis CCUG 21559]
MIISKNWLNEWVDLSAFGTEKILKTLNSIGFEVDGFKEIKIPQNIVVGYVTSKDKHPDADKLNICQVDIGSEILQIVCGAKNVEAGQFVPVALIGAVMPNGLEIKKAKLRGVESCGMICSSTELGLAKTNDGIMVLDESIGKLELGKKIADFECFNDAIIEIDITANRGDANSINGIARELGVALDLNLKEITPYEDADNLPGIGRLISLRADEGLNSSVLYKAVGIKEKICENLLTSLRLALMDCKKTNNLERLLDYATYSTGVLFRAYDFDKLSVDERANFDIKKGKNEESIISSDGKILGVVGVYQSDFARISDDTKIAIIEASFSSPDVIAQTTALDKQMPRDEHLYRSSRGSEPFLAFGVEFLFRKFSTFKELALYGGVSQHVMKREQKMLNFSLAEIDKMIGQKIERNDILRILKKLGFEINFNQEAEIFNVKIPLFRHDIVNSHDVCEEIVRIVGIDNIASKPMKFSEENRLNNTYKRYKFALDLRKKSASAGFFESVHYVFDSADELKILGFTPCKAQIANPINNELNELRPTLINHLLSSAEKNIKNQKRSVKLFEYGAVFNQNGDQSSRFGFIHAGLLKEPSLVNGVKIAEVDFLSFANSIKNVIGEFELLKSDEIAYLSPFEQAKIYKNGVEIGYIGRLHVKFADLRDLPKTYLCEIYFDAINHEPIKAVPYSKFPSISRDLSLIVPSDMEFRLIKEAINELKIPTLKEFLPVDIYRSNELGKNVSLSVKFTFQDMNSSLTDDEVAVLMDKILAKLNEKLSVGIR